MSRRQKQNPRGAKKAGKRRSKAPSTSLVGKQRLQRWLASAGFGSRRQCEELIQAGRVEVDGAIVTKLGTKVDPSVSKVRVDGVELKKRKLVYYAVNKPIGFVTTNADPQGRRRVIDLVPTGERVFPVGRLDLNSEGLLLLTNDGELAQQLSHPKFGVRKVYRVTVAGKVDGETMKQMRRGIFIAEGRVSVEGARILKSRARSTELEIVLREGKNREIRRILARLGHKVQHLRRIAVGPLRLGDLPAGAYRPLTRTEIQKLKLAVDETTRETRAPRQRKSSKRGGDKVRPAGGRQATGTQKGRTSGIGRDERVESDRPAARGAVIGADSAEREESSRKSRPGRKRTVKKRTAKKRSKRTSTTRGSGRGAKKSKATRASSTTRRGAARKATKKKARPKQRPAKKGKRSKD